MIPWDLEEEVWRREEEKVRNSVGRLLNEG